MAAQTPQPNKQAEGFAFTVDEFADTYRVSRAALYNMWRSGQGPGFCRCLRDVPIQPFQRTDRVEMHPHWENPPAIYPLERFLARTFLRRYATWCVRTERYAAAQGNAALHRELAQC